MELTTEFFERFGQIALGLPKGSPEIPVGHPMVGRIGRVIPGKEFRLQGMSARTFRALLQDEARFIKNPRWAMRELGAVAGWADIFSARLGTALEERLGTKGPFTTSQTTLWYDTFTWSGMPGPGSIPNVDMNNPPGQAYNADSAGAFPLSDPGTGKKKLLLDVGIFCPSTTCIVMVGDLLVAVGGIQLNTYDIPGNGARTNPRLVAMPDLPRYTDGVGVLMSGEKHASGSYGLTHSYTLKYTNTANETNHTSGGSAFRYNYANSYVTQSEVSTVNPGPLGLGFQSGDKGCKKITAVSFSGDSTDAKLAVLCFKPLMLIPSLSTVYSERPIQNMLAGVAEIQTDVDGTLGCVNLWVNCVATSTQLNTIILKTLAV